MGQALLIKDGSSMDFSGKFRLVTRSDFDGLICAVLLKHLDMLDDIKFVHPKDMQDGIIEINDRDITTNLPYVPGCHASFDHHLSETLRNIDAGERHIIDPDAPSAARVVYDYFGGEASFPADWEEMMLAVDQADSAQYSREDILEPQRWTLLNYLMDARTGLGRFHEFRISNYELMMHLIEDCTKLSIDQILELPDVAERVALYREHDLKAKEQIKRCSTVHGKLVVLDLLNEETIYCTNRFTIYALFPECSISLHKMWGLRKQNVVFAIGKSILDRGCKTIVGELCLRYGGGGHNAAGTCQVPTHQSEVLLKEVVDSITATA